MPLLMKRECSFRLNAECGMYLSRKNAELDQKIVEKEKVLTSRQNAIERADQTLENVIRKILFEEFPDLKDVEVDDSIDQDLLDFARKLLKH